MPQITSGPYDGRTPYDDDPDWIQEAEKYLKAHSEPDSEERVWPIEIIKGLLQVLDDEGIT